MLRRYLSNTDLKHMTVLEAVLPDESSKAKLVLTRCQPLQPLLGLLHPQTSTPRTHPSRVLPVSTRRRSCCASLFLRTTISVWNTPRRSLPSKRSAWRSRCAPSLPVKPPKPLSHPRTLHHPHTTQTLAPPTNMALVHIRQGAQRDGGPEVVSTACFPRHALRSKSAHSKTFAEDGYTVERM